jgi:uncharacterized YigZ family protein
MDAYQDQYKTIAAPSGEILYKDRNSKFYGYAFPIETEEDAKHILGELRKTHPGANHVCYAWKLGITNPAYKANDDGEPNNSAGMPIYGRLQSFEVTNILLAVVRFFGGTKLGVGGLIQAYRSTAQQTLENSKILVKTIQEPLSISFNYVEMNKVMQIVKKNRLSITSQSMDMNCHLLLSVRKRDLKKIKSMFRKIPGVEIKD